MSVIFTYQDYEKAIKNNTDKAALIITLINKRNSEEEYQTAYAGNLYSRGENATITQYQKLLYEETGKAIPDNNAANFKCKSKFFMRSITQLTSMVVGNGIFFNNDSTKELLGGSSLDPAVYKGVYNALAQKCSFGFWNYDHLEFFKLLEFIPMFDEETGVLRAGLRYWTCGEQRPIRADLFEEDGMTQYIINKDRSEGKIMTPKKSYKQLNGTDAGNYTINGVTVLPIFPLWGNIRHQSELEGIREQIDCYDFIKSGLANDLDEASMFYWSLKNTGGLTEKDAVAFIDRVKRLHIADYDGEDGSEAEAHTLEVPWQSRESYLQILRDDLYRDSMSLDVEKIAAGAVTATQIKAAYEPLNEKADGLIMCLCEFFEGVLALAGIDDAPSFKPSLITNDSEITQMVLASASFLDRKTILKKLPFISDDEIDEILNAAELEEQSRFEQEQVVAEVQQADEQEGAEDE